MPRLGFTGARKHLRAGRIEFKVTFGVFERNGMEEDHVVVAPTVRISAGAKDEILQRIHDLERELEELRRAVQEVLR